MRPYFKPDQVFACLFRDMQLHAVFASESVAKNFSAVTGGGYTTRIMTLRELVGIDHANKNGTKLRVAQVMGHRGGIKGGRVRAAKLNPEQRKSIASLAAKARWAKYRYEHNQERP